MTNVFLGYPPEHIRKWILDHASGSDKPEEKYIGPLRFTAQEDNATVGMVGPCGENETTNVTASLQTSTDGVNWNTYDGNGWDGSIITLNKGEKLYVKALNPNSNLYGYGVGYSHKFVIQNGKVEADGNIQYLLDSTCKEMKAPEHCYSGMFKNCTSLTQAPELPATTLEYDCYSHMFYGCTSLIQAPELPATTLAASCYQYMFRGCTSLTQAPELPATNLEYQCYDWMFHGCNQFSEVHMKSEMNGQYSQDYHGDTTKTVVYDL